MRLKTFLQSKLGRPSSRRSSGPMYRKLRMSLVDKSLPSRLLSKKCVTVGFARVSCSDRNHQKDETTKHILLFRNVNYMQGCWFKILPDSHNQCECSCIEWKQVTTAGKDDGAAGIDRN